MSAAPLADWANFYVITGSAAAGLTGLTFVVIALAADLRRANPTGLRAFITPTIVHFSVVLGLAAFMCVPHQAWWSAATGVAATGGAGLAYAARIAWHLRSVPGKYIPVLEDWIWNVFLPMTSYAALLAAGVLLRRHPDASLCGVAAASMLLLFIGIHNAWDIAVWMTLTKQEPPPP